MRWTVRDIADLVGPQGEGKGVGDTPGVEPPECDLRPFFPYRQLRGLTLWPYRAALPWDGNSSLLLWLTVLQLPGTR